MIDKLMDICLNNKLISMCKKNAKLKSIIDKFKNKDFFTHILKYIIAGILATIISIGSLWLLTKCTTINENICNFISIVLTIIFAYVMNRIYVFNSKEKNIISEFFKFALSRALSSLFDMITFFIFVTLLNFNKIVMKILINIAVMIINYFLSKIVVFKHNNI